MDVADETIRLKTLLAAFKYYLYIMPEDTPAPGRRPGHGLRKAFQPPHLRKHCQTLTETGGTTLV